MGIGLLVALEGRGIKTCEMTNVFVFFKVLCSSAAGKEIRFIRPVFSFF